MSDVLFWLAVLLAVLLFGRAVLAYLRRYLPLLALAAVVVLLLTQCRAETVSFIDNLG